MAVMTSTGLPIYQLDVDDYEQIVATGVLDGQRVELIDGIITEMSSQSPEHSEVLVRLTGHFAGLAARRLLRVQMPLHVTTANSLPEPDLVVAVAPSYPREHPRTARLVIEVAVSSQALDRGRKLQLYAATGIGVYWLVDVAARTVEVRTGAGADGYGAVTVYGEDETVPPPVPGVEALAVSDLFAGLPEPE